MPTDEPPFNSRRTTIALWAIGLGAAIIGLALWAVILL